MKRARTEIYDPRKHKSRTEWGRIDRLTDAELAAAAAADPDAPPIPLEEWLRHAVPMPPLVKKGVFLRLDPDVVTWFKEGGPGYQTRMNRVLRAYMIAHRTGGRRKGRAKAKARGSSNS